MSRPETIVRAQTPAARIGETASPSGHGIAADLIAVLVAVTNGDPRVLTLQEARALPSGPFELEHRSLQSGLRAWVERQTHHPLGYVEQLYTFADRDRGLGPDQRFISISYLGLTRERANADYEAQWRSWYDYLPWEDRRVGIPPMIDEVLVPALARLCRRGARPRQGPGSAEPHRRHLRPRGPALERRARPATL